MKIAIIGTRGIPNYYGGFEQFAEYLSLELIKKGFEVTVYNSHSHPYQDSLWNGVKIIRCYDPEDRLGTIGQFIYDFNCIMDSRTRNFDIILQLGYTSSSIWGKLLPRKKTIVTTNMDGLEWKRTKYSKRVQNFLKFAERLAVKNSDYLIADSLGIQKYLYETYGISSTYIPYGANVFNTPDASVLDEFSLQPFKYDLLIARLEPENSIEIILDGIAKAVIKKPCIVVGNYNTSFGRYLKDKFVTHLNIRFLGSLYNLSKLNNLRYYSNLYFHGHTVGGTNPSLLEAMASNALVCAHDNIFNKAILGRDAYFFTDSEKICSIVGLTIKEERDNQVKLVNNLDKIAKYYLWEKICDQYVSHFNHIRSKTSCEN